jgi:hypothetical protein
LRYLRYHIIWWLLIFPFALQATGDVFPIGARSAGLCYSSVALEGFWGLLNNQAAVATLKKPVVGISYENKFFLKETSNNSLAFAYPLEFGVLGFDLNYFGYGMYNEMKIGMTYARAFGKYIRVGVQLDYLRTAIADGYGSLNNVTFEVGIQSDVTEEITLGAYVFNPVRVKVSDYDNERIPALFRFGLTWRFTSNFFATAEVEKDSFMPSVVIRGGLEYTLKEKFVFRTGVASRQNIFALGFGINLKGFRFDIASVLNQFLGFSPQVSLSYSF